MKKRRTSGTPQKAEKAWTPFLPCQPDPRAPGDEIFKNSRYQVHIRRTPDRQGKGPDLIHLSFKRVDQGTYIPWRDKQRLKNELVGPEFEAVELYPAERRLVDSANQYHLWLFASPTFRWPFGFNERFVTDVSHDGSVQAPFSPEERPADCLDEEQLMLRMAEEQAKRNQPPTKASLPPPSSSSSREKVR